ncbi:MAG TPA: sigma-54 dependent transcriptional regulator [Polyangiaceae bacterium]
MDDETDSAFMMKMVLEHVGHKVVAVASPGEALDVIMREEIDVVVTDLSMKELDGIGLCTRIKSARPGTPVIIITAHANLDVAIEAIRAGAFDFVLKPFEAERLAAAVDRAADERTARTTIEGLQASASDAPQNVLGSSAAMMRVQELVERIAATDTSVLIQGETGTGKELVARALHDASGARGRFVALNCAAMPFNLLESELFGHARGAFTDARTQRNGLFLEAENGTIFLDEIGELPLEVQPKLLRALQERTVRPVGSNAEIPFSARLVVATNRNLEQDVREKRFREDLYYRINVIKVELPALRERGTDVIELAARFLARQATRIGKPVLKLSTDAAQRLLDYPWPGNVRELENCMEYAAVLARHHEVRITDLPQKVRDHRVVRVTPSNDIAEIIPIDEYEKRYVVNVIVQLGGNKKRAAQRLGMDRKTLYRKLERWGVSSSQLAGQLAGGDKLGVAR